MYVEERVYRLLPGCIPAYFALYEARGLVPQSRYLDMMLGYYAAEIGALNEVVHLWLHRSLDERDARRAAMRADPDFAAYWEDVRGMIVEQRTRILKPAPFFAGRLAAIAAVVSPGEAAATAV
ncbi:MAG: NIPSNAP family protein [Novosphingobium sp.]